MFLLIILVFVPGVFASPQTFVDVKTDKNDYLIGEQVSITIKNLNSYPISFSDSSMGLRITNLFDGENLLGCMRYLQALTTLETNAEFEMVWDPINDCPEKSVFGMISINVTYYDEAYDSQFTKGKMIKISNFVATPSTDIDCDFSKGPIFVATDKKNYDRDDVLNIDVCLTTETYTKGVNLIFYDADGERVNSITFPPPSQVFNIQYLFDEKFETNGTYTVEIDAAGIHAASTNFVVPEFGVFVIAVLATSIISIIFLVNKSPLKF